MSADAFAADKNLWRGLDIVLGLERIDFLARGQPVVFDGEALALQEIECLEAIGAGMTRHDHAIDSGNFRGGAGLSSW